MADIAVWIYYRMDLQRMPTGLNRNTLNIGHLFYCVSRSQNIMLPRKFSPRNDASFNMRASGINTSITM